MRLPGSAYRPPAPLLALDRPSAPPDRRIDAPPPAAALPAAPTPGRPAACSPATAVSAAGGSDALRRCMLLLLLPPSAPSRPATMPSKSSAPPPALLPLPPSLSSPAPSNTDGMLSEWCMRRAAGGEAGVAAACPSASPAAARRLPCLLHAPSWPSKARSAASGESSRESAPAAMQHRSVRDLRLGRKL